MKNAYQILSSITESLASGCLILMTDSTVTRKATQVELTESNLSCCQENTLDVRFEGGRWIQLPLSWPWDDLVGYGLICLNNVLYIAPDWWLAL